MERIERMKRIMSLQKTGFPKFIEDTNFKIGDPRRWKKLDEDAFKFGKLETTGLHQIIEDSVNQTSNQIRYTNNDKDKEKTSSAQLNYEAEYFRLLEENQSLISSNKLLTDALLAITTVLSRIQQ